MNLNESSAVMWKTRFIFVSHTTLFSNTMKTTNI